MPHPRAASARRPPRRRLVARAAFAGGSVALLAVGLWPTSVDAPVRGPVFDLVTALRSAGFEFANYGLIDFVANILWFALPASVMTVVLGRRFGGAVLLGLGALSVGIELLQAALLSDRVGSVSDVAANVLGAGLGVLVAAVIDQAAELRRMRRAPRRGETDLLPVTQG